MTGVLAGVVSASLVSGAGAGAGAGAGVGGAGAGSTFGNMSGGASVSGAVLSRH